MIIPTVGHGKLDQLRTCLQHQLNIEDEVLVVGDTLDGPLTNVEAFCADAGWRYVNYAAAHHCAGHCQLNYALSKARGLWLLFMDDDDVFTPNALAVVREDIAALTEMRPLLYRFRTYHWRGQELDYWTVWDQPRLQRDCISGQCLVAPNIPRKLGTWTCQYNGDYDFIESTVAHYPQGAVWKDFIIGIARPHINSHLIEWTGTS